MDERSATSTRVIRKLDDDDAGPVESDDLLVSVDPVGAELMRLRRETSRLQLEKARLEREVEELRGRFRAALDLGRTLAQQRNEYIEKFAESEGDRRALTGHLHAVRRELATSTLRRGRPGGRPLVESGELRAVAASTARYTVLGEALDGARSTIRSATPHLEAEQDLWSCLSVTEEELAAGGVREPGC